MQKAAKMLEAVPVKSKASATGAEARIS